MKTFGKTFHIASLVKLVSQGAGAVNEKIGKKTKESFDTQKIKTTWIKATSEVHAKYTDNMYLKGSRLIVKISSPTVRSDLFWRESQIITKLNQELKEDDIKITSIYWK